MKNQNSDKEGAKTSTKTRVKPSIDKNIAERLAKC
jgi:hypothetical protein